MFSRSKKKGTTKRLVSRPATITIVQPEQGKKEVEPALDWSTAKITILEPEKGFRIMVEESEGEEDE